MHLRVIHWNIRVNCDIKKVIGFLFQNITERCLVNLQEVSETSFGELSQTLKEQSIFSLHFRPPGCFEGRNRRMGVATLVFGGSVERASLLERSVFPERTLITEISMDGHPVKNFTFHSLTGVDYKKAKSSNFASIAGFLALEQDLDFFSCDANEPKVDSYEDSLIEMYDNGDKGRKASLVFGGERVHGLKDSFKDYSKRMGLSLSEGFTFMTGKTKRRYDHIYHNPKWEVLFARSFYKESIEASSDHAMVVCDYVYLEQ